MREGSCKKPPELYIDKDVCPGEGCQYGEWKTSEPIVILEKPIGKREIGEIKAGESFLAITGNVYVRPLEKIASVSTELTDSIFIEPGQKYYLLSNIGEGISKIWVNGQIFEYEDYNPDQQWWVKIKTKNGKKGWIKYPVSGCISGSDFLE